MNGNGTARYYMKRFQSQFTMRIIFRILFSHFRVMFGSLSLLKITKLCSALKNHVWNA